MSRIYATALVSSTDGRAFQAELDAEVLKWQGQGTGLEVEIQFATNPVAVQQMTCYSALVVVRRPA